MAAVNGRANWREWLARWSDEWVRSAEPAELDPEVQRDRWLGFAPASEEAVAAAEARLGYTLPPSYREFLLTTDGWRNAGMFVWRMRDTSNLGWLRDIEPFWEESWEDADDDLDDDFDEDLGDESADEDSPSDNKFSRGLLISLQADAGILFLDPGDVDENGEWAAYSLFSWRAAPPTRFPSFTALMEDLYAEFHQMRKPAGETRDSWDVKVEQARLDALAGDADGASAVLEKAEEFGRIRATVLRVQLELLLGNDYQAGMLLSRLLHPGFMPDGWLTDPLFTEELMPWLLNQHAKTPGYRNSILQSALIGEQPDIQLAIAEGQARLRNSGTSFGNPEFDTLIRQALQEHAADPDALWHAVRAAMAHWRPRTVDHLAPIILLTNPDLAQALTRERGHELLSIPRGER
ncbi:SMI1 / KNR4 family (SUKH-1) [Kibdelosporangium aridum]|uniref:SMI1 / KNR4 family (SUKH-1) n=1 Tax=Kibdelosporangium aridum TaxID=2030 RepID=A0A1Y5Y4S8_KIBAR|nr:SMI1 / KNR4 family (SUKH-1) [Kibdelosporangium aridum]